MERNGLSELYGNEQLKAYLSSAVESGTLPHALLFCGPEGSGKNTVATALACMLGGERYAEKIRTGNCPDVIRIGLTSDRKSIGVETARQIRQEAAITPNDLNCKIFVIGNADTMTAQAQNALLKLLEEPQGNTYFFLLCQNANAVIPTVRSRAPVLYLQIFSEEELSAALWEREPSATKTAAADPASFTLLLRQAQGCIGKATQLLHTKRTTNVTATARALLETLASADPLQWLAQIELLPSERDKLLPVLQALRLGIRDLVYLSGVLIRSYDESAAERAEKKFLCFPDAESAKPLCNRFSQAALLRAETRVALAAEDLENNANVSNVRQKCSAELWEICRNGM